MSDFLNRRRFLNPRNAPWQPLLQAITVPPEDNPPAVEGHSGYQDQTPRTKRRAANRAYEVSRNDLAVDEPLPEGLRVSFANPYPSRRFAARHAYVFPHWVIGPEIPTEGTPVIAVPQSLYTKRRAANAAYFRTNLIPQEEPPLLPEGGLLLPSRAPGARRAAQVAYLAGGRVEDWTSEGATLPGCPYRPRRPDESTTYSPRPDECA